MRTYLILLVLACLFPGVMGATILFVYEYNKSRVELEKDTIQTVRALVQAIDYHMLRGQAVAQALSTSEALAKHDFAAFHAQARDAIRLSGLGTNAVLRDRAGRQLLNTAVDFGKPLAPSPAPEQVRAVFEGGKPTVSDVFVGPMLKRPLVSVDVPVKIEGGIAYALGVGILPEHFNVILKAQSLPSNWVASIFDGTGTIVARTHGQDKYAGQKVARGLLESLATRREGAVDAPTKEGIPSTLFYSRSAVTDWGVVIAIPTAGIVGGFVRTLAVLALGVAALFMLGITLARLMGSTIARSVMALTEPAAAVGNGAPVNVPQVQVSEAAEVASAIGRAAALLRERDIALRAKTDELLEAHRLARIGTWYWDFATGQVVASEQMKEIFGRAPPPFQEQRGQFLTVESWEKVELASRHVMREGKGYDLELQAYHADGHVIWVNAKCEPVRNESNEVVGLRGMLQDITERKLAETRAREAALHDPLTGLPNRALVFEYCDRVIAASKRNHSRGALLFIDLDRFKPVNDLHGHEAGDLLLKEVGRRLTACTRHEDLAGRLGGDEFVIVLPYLASNRARAAVIAEHLIESIGRPVRINGLELTISASIGISFFPEHATDVSALLHAADMAMYHAKQSGRGRYQYYSPELDRQANQALQVEARLKNAIRQRALALHYQPIIDIKSGDPIAAEALVRLADDGNDAVGPDRFVPVAESTGLIADLGDWVIAEVCRQQEAWQKQGLRISVAINVSPIQFRQHAFVERLAEIISNSRIDPGLLEIEVTESTVMDSVDEAVGILNRIKSLGIRVALDDFGTGYSSLSSLSNLPLDKLKVDQSFVRRVERDHSCRVVTEAIIALGRSLKLNVVGEGIESENVLRYLEKHGCNQAQGYWFSQPLPSAEFTEWYWRRRQGHRAFATDTV